MRHRDFWNREYNTGAHLALSTEPSEDLQKFTRFLERREGHTHLNSHALVIDMGCGNGRNLAYLARTFGMRGIGYDISEEAIRQARELVRGLPVICEVRSIEGNFDIKDGSTSLVLDMMTSHVLKQKSREHLRDEIIRLLKPGGWLFFKSFFGEEDRNAHRMLREHPADEEGAYVHPIIGAYEYVWPNEDAIHSFFEPHFTIHKIEKSHRHLARGRANKRRTISVYLERLA